MSHRLNVGNLIFCIVENVGTSAGQRLNEEKLPAQKGEPLLALGSQCLFVLGSLFSPLGTNRLSLDLSPQEFVI